MAAIVPDKDRMFNYEYVQLHSVAEQGDSRLFHAEGPLVIGRAKPDDSSDPRPPLLHIGMPENMITWALTSDLPTLKVQRTAFMAAVPYSQRFFIIDFLPETPDDVLAAFERVLAQTTSFAVANVPAQGDSPAVTTAAIRPADQEQVEAASGHVFTTDPQTAGKVRDASTAIADNISQLGEHLGKGIVRAGEWYRKRSEGKQKNVQINESHMRRMESAKTATEKTAVVAGTFAAKVGSAIGSAAYGAKEGLMKSGTIREGGKVHRAGGKAKQGVIALIEVFDAMHDSARHVLSTGVEETATCVQYRYGDQAGALSRRSMGMAVDAYDVYGSYRAMRTRALAKAFFKGSVREGELTKLPEEPTTSTSTNEPQMPQSIGQQPPAPAMQYGQDGTTYMPPERIQQGSMGPGLRNTGGVGMGTQGVGARRAPEEEYSMELVQPLAQEDERPRYL